MEHFASYITIDNTLEFGESGGDMPYFLDWPTLETEDAKIGTAALITLVFHMEWLEVSGQIDKLPKRGRKGYPW